MTGSGMCFARRAPPRHARGFTLIEMMITLLIMAILTVLAAPSLNDMVRDQRIKSATFDVYASLAYARSEAIKRNANVDVTPVGTDWAGGWTIAAGSTTLKNQGALSGINITGPTVVTYLINGRLSGGTAPAFVLKSSQSSTAPARCVNVDLSGRPNIKTDTNHDPSDGCN